METGTDIVLVHGWAGSAEAWDPVAACLAERRSFRVHAVRLPGSPGSDSSADRTIAAAAAEVEALIRALDAPAALVGHSMGAQVTTRAHTAAPDAVLTEVVLDPAYGADADTRSEMAAWADDIASNGHAAVDGFFAEAIAGLAAADRERLRADLLATSPDTIARYLRSEYVDEDAIGLLPASARAAAMRTRRVLAVHSSLEGLAREQRLPSPRGSRIDVWQGHGHYFHLEDPERFASLLADWVLTAAAAQARESPLHEEIQP